MRIHRSRWNVWLPGGGVVEGLTHRQARRVVGAWRAPVVALPSAGDPGAAARPQPCGVIVAAPATDTPAGPPPTAVTLVAGADQRRSPSVSSTSLRLPENVTSDLRRAFRRAIDDPSLLQVPRPLPNAGDRRSDARVATTMLACQVALAA